MRRITRTLGAALLVGLVLGLGVAHAAVTGNISGRVTDDASGKALAGVTVTVSGSALQGEQTEFTDSSGRYIITELPPGEYIVRFYFSNIKVERPGVFLKSDETLQVNAAVPTQSAKTQTYRIIEKAPTVDVGNTQIQTAVTDEVVKNTPIAGRNYTSVLTLAPGSTTDAVGFSFNGATGPENNFLLDGLNTTSPAFGLVGTNLSTEFIKETEIITAGYNAEYGRATGAVINVVTKQGSNEFHGAAWFYYQPFQLDPQRVARYGEAIASQGKLSHAFDFGFDLGGPILKDKIWFYVGFNPQFRTTELTRILRQRTADNVGDGAKSYAGDLDMKAVCPSYLTAVDPSKNLCPFGGYITKDLDQKYWKTYQSDTRSYQWIAKLNFQLNENNSLSLEYIGTPSTFDGYAGITNGAESANLYSSTAQTHDVLLHFISKLLDRKLQLDFLAGFHFEADPPFTPTLKEGNNAGVTDTRTVSLALYEPGVTPCAPTTVKTATFNPCPVSSYRDGGLGFVNDLTQYRFNSALALTYFARGAGTHAIKLGGDFEYVSYRDRRLYTGGVTGGRFTVFTDGSVERDQFGTNQADGTVKLLPITGFEANTKTLNEGFYLRDSWNVGFLPGLTLNVGLRWELQQVNGMPRKDGKLLPDPTGTEHTEISIWDNIAPRIGFVYDFTRKGYSKIYASYGRFYESIPLDLNDRQFSGEGIAIQAEPGAGVYCTSPGPQGISAATKRFDPTTCKFPNPISSELNGGSYAAVSPILKGQYTNDVVAGLQYDVGLDLVLGAAYVHKDYGRIIEDMSPDGGAHYIIANPGDSTDQGTVQGLQNDIDALQKQVSSTTDPMKKADLQTQLNNKALALQLYKGVETFDKPKREYNALVLTATKRFSHNFIVLASYTYSRTLGNYPGLYSGNNGQLDPNISSQYDLKELLINRYGPLQNDRPHNFKLNGAYIIPLGGGGLTLGLTFSAVSGAPINVLGRHPLYGAAETYILPAGAGGRTPTVTQLDLRVAYGRQFGKLLRVELSWDIFNVFNQQEVLTVNQQYTTDRVLPILNGSYADLVNLKNTNGAQAARAPNYGNPTSYQSPLTMRFGLRVSF